MDNMEQGTEEGEALRTAKDAAAKFGCVFAVTGPIDNISNGKQAVVLNNVTRCCRISPAAAA